MVFSLDDQNLMYDIRGDNKMFFLDWKQEVAGLWPEKDMLDRIKKFREKNFNILD